MDAGPRVDADTVCAGDVSTAELVPLDIYVMLDRSGSMNDKAGTMGQGAVKWEAVTTALSVFVADPRSQGIGVGLQYFPMRIGRINLTFRNRAVYATRRRKSPARVP